MNSLCWPDNSGVTVMQYVPSLLSVTWHSLLPLSLWVRVAVTIAPPWSNSCPLLFLETTLTFISAPTANLLRGITAVLLLGEISDTHPKLVIILPKVSVLTSTDMLGDSQRSREISENCCWSLVALLCNVWEIESNSTSPYLLVATEARLWQLLIDSNRLWTPSNWIARRASLAMASSLLFANKCSSRWWRSCWSLEKAWRMVASTSFLRAFIFSFITLPAVMTSSSCCWAMGNPSRLTFISSLWSMAWLLTTIEWFLWLRRIHLTHTGIEHCWQYKSSFWSSWSWHTGDVEEDKEYLSWLIFWASCSLNEECERVLRSAWWCSQHTLHKRSSHSVQ